MDMLINLIVVCLILVFICYLYHSVAKYGEKTSMGYGGTMILSIFSSPIVAFLIIFFFLEKRKDIY
jgi:uncharacterized membrane protein